MTQTAGSPSASGVAGQAYIDWHARASRLVVRGQAFIDGNYVDATSGETFDCLSPIDGRVLARVAACTAEDVDLAVTAARRAFERKQWSAMRPVDRKRVLCKFADLIRAHAEELALLETLDMGKPIADSLSIDAASAARCMQWYGESIDKIYGEIAPTSVDSLALVMREPIGVVAAVVPWNFPLVMACWKLGPALAAGNSVVLKPSERSPLTAIRIAELAVAAGLPRGVLNVVPGFGYTAGKALAMHLDVDCIAFTGSTTTGRLILEYAGRSNMKRAWLECGGKSPNIVFADAPDIERAAQAAASAIFFNQGEMCSAGSRLLVQESIREQLVQRVVEIGSLLQPGDPLDPQTKLGALVDEPHLRTVLGYIDAGRAEGAVVRLGGARARVDSGGSYVQPTIFDCVRPEMKIAREEIFGPVLSVIGFEDADEAIRIANDGVYGLAAGVWTRNLTNAHRVARAVRAGSVYVNCYDADDITVPFGGFKQSGIGRDKSLHAFDKYTELKTTWIELG